MKYIEHKGGGGYSLEPVRSTSGRMTFEVLPNGRLVTRGVLGLAKKTPHEESVRPRHPDGRLKKT